MRKLLALLTLLAFLILLWFAKSKYQACCEDYASNQKVVSEKKNVVVEKVGPLVYKWDNSTPMTNELWTTKKSSILKQMQEGSILRIVGPYFENEKNSSTFANMGLARASKVKALFAQDIDTARIHIASKIVTNSNNDKTKLFEHTIFAWVVENENVKQDETGKALVYFPHGSAKEIKNQNILDFVKNVAEKAIKTGKTVTITGFTDNTGDPEKNKALGLSRANSIKRLLLKYGVSEDKIIAASQGIENPIATNDTAAGRALNRRVEIEVK